MTTSADRSPQGEAARVVRPTFGFMRVRLSRWVALGFGSGLSPWAPGTVGTLWAWAVWQALALWLTTPALLLLIAGGFALGVWACGRTAEALGVVDHGGIVWDEVVAFWLVLAVVPDSLLAQSCGFVLFRLFDIVKPPPIRHFERRIPGGFGVMFDDLLAAIYTLLVFLAWGAW